MFAYSSSRAVAQIALRQSRVVGRRFLSDAKVKATTTAESTVAKEAPKVEAKTTEGGWWHSPQFWGGLGALAGWGMSGAAIYDASQSGPEVISMKMTPVLIVYSTLFARWAWIVQPRNLLLCSCHVANVGAQLNQLRRALEYKLANGQEQEVQEFGQKTAMGGAIIAGSILAGPHMRKMLTNANMGVVSTVAAAPAGPFTVHFWAPMSKVRKSTAPI